MRRIDCFFCHRATFAWSPERRTSGTVSPCQSSGLEYCGYSRSPDQWLSSVKQTSSPSTPGIRRETAYHRYNSYRGVVGRTFENVIARNFDAGAPWRKLGTDVTEFKVAGGKAYWAPTLDFCSKEIVASDISTTPDMAQQMRMLDELLPKIPEGAAPTMHSDRGWQYQHASYTSRLEAAGIVQSMSRKANCIDNAATEQLFGHVKDEFYRGREWETFEDFKRDLEEYIVHWNTSRRQVRLKGLTPEEFRNQALAA